MPQAVGDLNGQTFLLAFNSCETGSAMDPIVLSGSLSIALNSVSGNLTTGNYELQTLINPINMSVADIMGVTNYSGGLAYNRKSNAGSLTEQVIIDANPLIISDEYTLTVHQLDLSATRMASGALNIGAAGESFHIHLISIQRSMVEKSYATPPSYNSHLPAILYHPVTEIFS